MPRDDCVGVGGDYGGHGRATLWALRTPGGYRPGGATWRMWACRIATEWHCGLPGIDAVRGCLVLWSTGELRVVRGSKALTVKVAKRVLGGGRGVFGMPHWLPTLACRVGW